MANDPNDEPGDGVNSSQTNEGLPNDHPTAPQDPRLYVPDENWQARIRRGGDRFYCYGKFEGEDWHHQIAIGELYLQRGHEVLCLACAIKQKVLTNDRVYWQHLEKDPNRRPLI